MAETDYDFSGVWRSSYRYTSSSRGPGIYENEHYVTITRKGNRLAVKSLPNSEDSQVYMHLTIEDRIVSGSWEEKTSEGGAFKGITYYGVVQFVMSEDGKRMEGKWLGAGRKLDVKDGPWKIERIGHTPPAQSDKKKG